MRSANPAARSYNPPPPGDLGMARAVTETVETVETEATEMEMETVTAAAAVRTPWIPPIRTG